MSPRLHFAYPDDHVDPGKIPNLLDLPALTASRDDHELVQARYARAGDVVVPLSEEGAIALTTGNLVDMRKVDRVAQWRKLLFNAHETVADGLVFAKLGDVLPGTIMCGREMADPRWAGPTWLKNAHSTMGCGVAQIEHGEVGPAELSEELYDTARGILIRAKEHHDFVRKFAKRDPRDSWLLQEHVGARQVEINLALAGDSVEVGPLLEQRWENGEIVEYRTALGPTPGYGFLALVAFTRDTARILGARWSFVCAEWRLSWPLPKLVEIHLRPGDDPVKGYPGHEWVPRACEWMVGRWNARVREGVGGA